MYLVRHGETNWNVEKRLQGQTDIPLNQTGHLQAKEMGQKLAKVSFSMAFSSDLLRAKRTAEIITIEKKMAVQTTEALRERSFGKLEGQSVNPVLLRRLYHSIGEYKKTLTKKQKKLGVETDEELIARLIPFLRETSLAYAGKNVLIVSHGGVMRTFLTHIGFVGRQGIVKVHIKNLAYIKLRSDGTDFFIEETDGITIKE